MTSIQRDQQILYSQVTENEPTGCATNPLVKPLLSYHGMIVSTFDALPENCAFCEIIKRIVLVILAPFAYLALGFVALIGMALNLCCQLQQKETHDLETPPTPDVSRIAHEALLERSLSKEVVNPQSTTDAPATDALSEQQTDHLNLICGSTQRLVNDSALTVELEEIEDDDSSGPVQESASSHTAPSTIQIGDEDDNSSGPAQESASSHAAPSTNQIGDEDDNSSEEDESEQVQNMFTVENYVLPALEKNKTKKNPTKQLAYMGQIQIRGELTKREQALTNVQEASSNNARLREEIETLHSEISVFLAQIRELEEKIQALKSSSSQSRDVIQPPSNGVPRPPPLPMPPPFRTPPSLPRAGILPVPPCTSSAPAVNVLSEADALKLQEYEQELKNSNERVREFYQQLENLDAQYEENLQIIKSTLFPEQMISLSDSELVNFVDRYVELIRTEIERLKGLVNTDRRGKAASVDLAATPEESEKPWTTFQKMVKEYDTEKTRLQTTKEKNLQAQEQIQRLQSQIIGHQKDVLENRVSRNTAETTRHKEMLKYKQTKIQQCEEHYSTRNTTIQTLEKKLQQIYKQLEKFVGEKGLEWTDLKPLVLEKIARLESGEIEFTQGSLATIAESPKPLRSTSPRANLNGEPSSESTPNVGINSSFDHIERQRVEKGTALTRNTVLCKIARETIRDIEAPLRELHDQLELFQQEGSNTDTVVTQIQSKEQERAEAQQYLNYYHENDYDQAAYQRFVDKHMPRHT